MFIAFQLWDDIGISRKLILEGNKVKAILARENFGPFPYVIIDQLSELRLWHLGNADMPDLSYFCRFKKMLGFTHFTHPLDNIIIPKCFPKFEKIWLIPRLIKNSRINLLPEVFSTTSTLKDIQIRACVKKYNCSATPQT